MDPHRRILVRERAGNRCEYCGLPQALVPLAAFHIEHIIPRQHGGGDDADNLALACHRCNLHKGPNLTGIDPITNQITPLFHPRRDIWHEHFGLHGATLVGLTPIGRTTIYVMQMNAPSRLELRMEWITQGESKLP